MVVQLGNVSAEHWAGCLAVWWADLLGNSWVASWADCLAALMVAAWAVVSADETAVMWDPHSVYPLVD